MAMSSSSCAEDVLIKHLIERLSQELQNSIDISSTTFSTDTQSILGKIQESLVLLSGSKVHVIANNLASALDKLLISSDSSRDSRRLSFSILSLLQLLQRCLQYQWDHMKALLRAHAQNRELSQEGQIRLKETEESILPPPLDETLARELLKMIKTILFRILTESIELREELTEAAGQTLFQLSATNYEAASSMIQLNSAQMDDTEVQVSFIFLEWLNLNSRRLSELLGKFLPSIQAMKKEAHRFGVAKSIRNIIWNWIDHYPVEFVKLCQSGTRVSNSTEQLFDLFDSWCASSSKKVHFWPCMMMLLILFPDSMMKASKETNDQRQKTSTDASIKNKVKFLESLMKAIKSSKLSEVAIVCYVDVCKASIFVSSASQSALRWIVPEVENELQERLFSPNNLFKGTEKDSEADRALMVDLLLALFRLSHRKVMNSIFQDCLAEKSPPLFRTVLVECVLRLATEKSQLPWNPTIVDVYAPHSANFRNLFRQLEKQVRANAEQAAGPASSIKVSKTLEGQSKQQIDILTKLTKLFHMDPNLPLYRLRSITPQQNMDEVRAILTGLCSSLVCFTLPELSLEATQALLVLHRPSNIARWCPENPSLGIWAIGSAVLTSLGRVIIDRAQLTLEQTRRIVLTIEEILVHRNKFFSEYKDSVPDKTSLAARTLAYATLETALLINFCSSQTSISSRSAVCLGLLCEEAVLLGMADDHGNPFLANISIYRQLADSCVLITGPKAQQKQIRSLLRRMEQHTNGNWAAWEEVNKRWTEYTTAVMTQAQGTEGEPSITPLSESERQSSRFRSDRRQINASTAAITQREDFFEEWINYTGFLTALSGAAVNKEKSSGNSTSPLVDNFLSQLLSHVVASNVNVRETVKMVLGTALAPAAYTSLFRILHSRLSALFGSAGQVHLSDDSTLFVDQTISIVKLIIELEGSTAADYAMLTDFEDLLLDLLKYVRQLAFSIKTIASKGRLCGLIDSMMAKRQYINIRSEFNFRNTLIEILVEWTSEFTDTAQAPDTSRASAPAPDQASRDLTRKTQELDLQCMKAILSLFQGLPLPGNDDEAKAKLFSDYFSFLTRLLTRCKKQAHSVLPELADISIQCLSALVSGNIDHGVEYFVRMGYHDDHDTRASFLKVLTNILNQGAEFNVEGEKYDKLVKLLVEHDNRVLLAWGESTPITEADEVCQLIIHFGEMTESTTSIVCRAIDAEVQRTDSEATLFRRNSMATKLLTAYAKLLGNEYLREIVSPILKKLMQDHLDMELDPVKFEPPESYSPEAAAVNLKNLTAACQAILDTIMHAVDKCPKQMREICAHLRKSVAQRFPGAENTAVAGFFFLRFLCPALVAPDGFGLVSGQLDRQVRRNLIVITKSLQNLANRVHFSKELYMIPMNDFIDGNIQMIEKLFQRFEVIPENAPQAPPFDISDEEREHDLERIHFHLHRSVEKIFKLLSSSAPSIARAGPKPDVSSSSSSSSASNSEAATSEPAPQSNKSLADRLQLLMGQLGTPPESAQRLIANTSSLSTRNSSAAGGSNTAFETFMNRMSLRTNGDTRAVEAKNIFFQHGFTAAKEPVFHYLARNYTGESGGIDPDILLFHVIKTLQPYYSKPWHLIIDLTLFSALNGLPAAICSSFHKMFPETAANNLIRVYVLNTNPEFKQYARKTFSKYVSSATQKKIHFLSFKELTEYIPQKELKLPDLTLSVERDVKASFAPVFKVSSQYGKKEVCLRLSTDLFQIHSTRTYQVLGRSATLCQLIHISNIDEFGPGGSEEEFYVKCVIAGSTQTMTFRAPSAKQVLQLLKASKDRYMLSDRVRGGRTFRPSDIRGALLNMSLLNLSSTNTFLREAAYNLLVALSRTFNFSVRDQLLRSSGMIVPRNSCQFVSRISSQLASSETPLTLEFLLESLRAFGTADVVGKHLCLIYIQPWLPNLAGFCQLTNAPDSSDKVAKTREVLISLINLSILEAGSLLPAILDKVWTVLGRRPELLELILDAILVASEQPGNGEATLPFEALQDVVITIAAQNPQCVSGKLISRLLDLLNTSSVESVPSLSSHPVWSQISVLLHLLLVLSFENLCTVQQYLPELFHIIMMVFGVGSERTRGTVHGMLINIIHSQYTYLASTLGKDDTGLERLEPMARALREELDALKFRLLFGIGHKSNLLTGQRKASAVASSSVQPDPQAEEGKKKMGSIDVSHVEIVAISLLSVLNTASPNGTAHGTTHHSRWLSLTTAQAFTTNLALQPRAMVVLGVLCQSPLLISEELFTRILSTFHDSLQDQANTLQSLNQLLSLAILNCLSKVFPYLSPSSSLYGPLFWLAMTLAQVNDSKMFAYSISLLEVILQTMDNNGAFDTIPLNEYLTSLRKDTLAAHLTKLDQVTGISFATSFSFAVSGHLLKGLKHAATKTQTVALLKYLVDISTKQNIGPNALGYLAALLPVGGSEAFRGTLLPSSVNVAAEGQYQILFNKEMLPDMMHAALLFSTLVTILKHSEIEHEKLFIYEALKEGVRIAPEAFPTVYDILLHKMTGVITSSQHAEIISAVLAIMQSMWNVHVVTHKGLDRSYLAKIGFHGLSTEGDSFLERSDREIPRATQRRKHILRIAASVIDALLGRG